MPPSPPLRNPRRECTARQFDTEFLRLLGGWKSTRGPSSSAQKLAEHPAYQQIIALGRANAGAIVSLLLAELERDPDHWFIALHAITGQDPVPAEARGRLREMADAWLEWGRANGFQW